jgi:hypothetical protein
MSGTRAIAFGLCLVLAGMGGVGCQTYGEAGGLGAALGGAAGAVIGHQSGHALEGAAIGAAVGGATGLIAHKVKVNKQRNREETLAAYQYDPEQGEALRFEGAENQPNVVRPGEMFESGVTYALMGTRGQGVEVSESRTLMRGDRVIAELATNTYTRDDGTYVSDQNFRLPNNQAPGEYSILTKVRTARSSISGRAPLIVE